MTYIRDYKTTSTTWEIEVRKLFLIMGEVPPNNASSLTWTLIVLLLYKIREHLFLYYDIKHQTFIFV